MDEIYVTYVDDEHVDNHDYDDTTDDDHDNNNGLAWSGPVWPGSGPGPVQGVLQMEKVSRHPKLSFKSWKRSQCIATAFCRVAATWLEVGLLKIVHKYRH